MEPQHSQKDITSHLLDRPRPITSVRLQPPITRSEQLAMRLEAKAYQAAAYVLRPVLKAVAKNF